MSKTTRGQNTESSQEELSFEVALKRLEGVVESMETGELPLEKLMEQYAEGSRLVALCQARLAQAELKIQEIERQADGGIQLRPVRIGSGASEAGQDKVDQVED